MAQLSVFRKLCVFCGSGVGSRPIYREVAAQFGQLFATSGIELVYGGGHVGLMGSIADAALGAGGTGYGCDAAGLDRP
jgi:predicted Rossmann-fold nucleotide-binding protein